MPGVEVLLTRRLDLLRGRRLGILANPAAIDRRFRHLVHLLVPRGDPAPAGTDERHL